MYNLYTTKLPVKFRLFLTIIVLIFFTTYKLFSQKGEENQTSYRKGFIIINNGDSLRGFVKGFHKNQLSKKIWFKPLTANEYDEQTFTPFDISSFGNKSGNSRYTSASIPLFNGPNWSLTRVDTSMYQSRLLSGKRLIF